MKGYIKIEAATYEGKHGLSVKTDLSDVSYMDRIAVLNSVCQAMHISPTELKLMAGLIGAGFMEEMTDTTVLEDETVPAEEHKCECGECTCGKEKKSKKPNVHVIGVDAGSDAIVELLKALLD